MSYRVVAQPAVAVKPTKPKNHPAQSLPFDPNELSRRLFLVVAEQKSDAERRRRARAEKTERRGKAAQSGSSQPKDGPAKASASSAAAPSAASVGRPAGDKSQSPTSTKEDSSSDKRASPDSKRSNSTAASIPGRKPSQGPGSAPKPAPEEGTPHPYVPRVAAVQFARTTTPGTMREGGVSHKQSKQGLKFHLEGNLGQRSLVLSSTGAQNTVITSTGAPFERTKSLGRSHSHRHRTHDRTQARHPRILEGTLEADDERDSVSHRDTSEEGRGCSDRGEHHQNKGRRSSTGDLGERIARDEAQRCSVVLLEPADPEEEGEEEAIDPRTADEHRVDWTQSDEPKYKPKDLSRPKMSIWALRGRLGGLSLTKHSREDKTSVMEDQSETPESPASFKSPKTGFFSRFKH